MNSKLFHGGVNYIVALYIVLVCGDIYSSVTEMENLVTLQKSVSDSLRSYLRLEMNKMSYLRKYLNKLKEQHNAVTVDPQTYVGNPMNRFLFTNTLTNELEFTKALINLKTEFQWDFSMIYPSKEDLAAVANSVARLQKTYLLNVEDLAAGKLKDYSSYVMLRNTACMLLYDEEYRSMLNNTPRNSTPMSATDFYELGRMLFEDRNTGAARVWLLQAYRMMDAEMKKHKPELLATIVEALCLAYIYLDDKKNIKKCVKHLKGLNTESDYTSKVIGVLKAKRELESDVEYKKKLNDKRVKIQQDQNISRHYGRLCRGEIEIPPEIQCRLKCMYLMNNPFLKLAPLKMEQLYVNPDIYLFYDVISDTEIEEVKSSGYPKLVRAQVSHNNTYRISPERLTFNSWLSRNLYPVVTKVYSRIEDMTGLSTSWAENLQLALYPPGGYYTAHYDTLKNRSLTAGYRIATVMFYLSEVQESGATVFINLGVTVFPIKGAALFWFNTHSSGETNNNTRHSACPVLQGYKWAANIWLSSFGHEFSHPCEIGGDKINETVTPPLWKLASNNSD